VKTILVVLLVLVLETFAVMLFTHRERVVAQIQEEYRQTINVMGEQNAELIYASADANFRSMIVDTGIFRESYRMFVPDGKRDMDGINVMGRGITWFEERLNAFWAVVFRSFQRLSLFNTWLPYALLLLVPAAVDGWEQRAIKRDTFGYTSPFRYAIAYYGIVLLLVFPVVYFLLPFPLSPLLPPMWALVATAAIVTMAANTQKHL